MIPVYARFLGKHFPLLLVGAIIAFLSACTAPPMGPTELQSAISRAEWIIVPKAQAWIFVPDAQLVMERRVGPVAEQRVTLINRTTLNGDNFVYLRAIDANSPGVIRLEQALEQAGGLPSPFSTADLDVMRSRSDGVGALSWTEWSSGAGTTCVFALRRMTVAARILPNRAGALDMVMRNCVVGEADAALRPAGEDAVGFPASARPAAGGSHRTLSPLAAPAP